MTYVGYLVWSFVGALVAALVSVALNRWAPGWSVVKRVFLAVSAATLPTIGIAAFFLFSLGSISLWFSPDEFLIPFTLQVLLAVVVSAPLAWLISRRGVRRPVPTDVFE